MVSIFFSSKFIFGVFLKMEAAEIFVQLCGKIDCVGWLIDNLTTGGNSSSILPCYRISPLNYF